MQTTFKQQMAEVKSIVKTKIEVAELLKGIDDKVGQKKRLKQAAVFNDVYSTLAAINMIGEKKIHALPRLIDLAEIAIQPICDSVVRHNAIVELRKLLKSIK